MKRPGMTLVELLVVIAIMAALAALVVPMVGNTPADAQKQVTITNMTHLRDTIMANYRPDMNKQLPRPNAAVSPSRSQTPQLRYLFVNPKTETTAVDFDPTYKLGWRGPYFMMSGGQYTVLDGTGGTANLGFTREYGETADPAIVDGWNRPIVVLERPDTLGVKHAWLMSAGQDGVLSTPGASGPGTNSTDDIVLQLY